MAMDLKSLSSKAKELIDRRGGTDSLKEDAEDLKSIAQGDGSLSDKAKAAVEAIKDPGATPEAAAGLQQPQQSDPERPAERTEPPEVEGQPAGREGRGGRGQGRGGRRRDRRRGGTRP
jgi:hypothetical protein